MMAMHPIAVNVIEGPDGASQVTAPNAKHRTNVHPSDLVVWTFDNQGGSPLVLGIGNFRAPSPLPAGALPGEPREWPLEPGSVMVEVPPKEQKDLVCQIKRSLQHRPRIYKYDIIDYTSLRVLLDPEIEVP
jgi:hypothetical protein